MNILVVCLNPTFQVTMRFDSFLLGEVNRCSEHYLDASGKGMNVARIVTQMHSKASLLTHLGGSRLEEMLSLCKKDNVEVLYTDSKSEIRTCTTILSGKTTTELVQEPHPVAPQTEEPIRKLYAKALASCDAVVITGTKAKGYSAQIYPDFVRLAKEAGKFVLLDIKGEDLKNCLPYKPDVIKPNLSEFSQSFLGIDVLEQEENLEVQQTIMQKMEEIHSQYGCTILLSRGKRDIFVQGERFFTVAVDEVEAVNTIGCGDTLAAVLTLGLLEGQNLQQAVIGATKAATIQAKTIHPGSLV